MKVYELMSILGRLQADTEVVISTGYDEDSAYRGDVPIDNYDDETFEDKIVIFMEVDTEIQEDD